MCRRTTTTPEDPVEPCMGPPGVGEDRFAFLQLVELRRMKSLLLALTLSQRPDPSPTPEASP